MPDSRSHRGAHPQDRQCFAADQLPRLRTATSELSWLLDRGYPPAASLRLVGDRHALRRRQRQAVGRCAAGADACADRRRRRLASGSLAGRPLLVDGYNVLLTVEAAFGGGVVLAAMDGCYRDMAAMGGNYRKVAETRAAIVAIGTWLADHGCGPTTFCLDRPVSNSGRLKSLMLELASAAGWPWQVELVADPDPLLAASREIVATADSAILDRDVRWLDLARRVVVAAVPEAWVVDLGPPPAG